MIDVNQFKFDEKGLIPAIVVICGIVVFVRRKNK